jgi:hypothetical protein
MTDKEFDELDEKIHRLAEVAAQRAEIAREEKALKAWFKERGDPGDEFLSADETIIIELTEKQRDGYEVKPCTYTEVNVRRAE